MNSKILIAFFLLFAFCTNSFAQIKPEKFKPFIGQKEIIGSSGPGLKSKSGDILLELKEIDDEDMVTLMLLRNINGTLSKIAENSNLVMGRGMLGNSGSSNANLGENSLSVDYTLGSNSSQSDVSMEFEKNKDGKYYFTTYTTISRNYGVENLFAREKITAAQTGKIDFANANEEGILKDSKSEYKDNYAEISKAAVRYKKFIPEGYQLATFAEGDLNADELKKDAVLVLAGEQMHSIRVLLQQKDGSYQLARKNDYLIAADNTYNANNLKLVIKNGYFTIEQRIPIDDDDFDHRYITFKYNAPQKDWLLYRFDVEHYSGFNPKPASNVTHLNNKDFGQIKFQKMDQLPGVYHFEPEMSAISGTITSKTFINDATVGIDKNVTVLVLKLAYPVNVYGDYETQYQELADQTVTDIVEIQLYSVDPKIDLEKYKGQTIKLQGFFQAARTAHHFTKVMFEVKKVL